MSVDVSQNHRVYLVVSILLSTFMVAVESTIIATALPSIVGQFGGFDHYSWVFSAFLLAQTTTTVIYGKLADIFGRKPVLIGGTVVFLFGSLACGFAWSMLSLVVFRLLQGIGAGAIQPLTITLVGDLYRLEERGRVQGLLASVWAGSAVVGPLFGGLLVDYVSWAWIFWMNIPIGILSVAGFAFFLHEKVEPRAARIDYLGAGLFTVSIASLLIVLSETDSRTSILAGFGALFLIFGVLFVRAERRAAEPIVSFDLWKRRLIATCNTTALLVGILLIGLTTILPLYVQGVLGYSPVVAGLALTMLILGWPLAVSQSMRLYRVFGLRRALRGVSLMLPAGCAILLFLSPTSHPVLAGIGSFVVGIGMGTTSFTCIVLIQESVEWSMRGSATASNIFARSLGSVLGATVVGAILNFGLLHFSTAEIASRVHKVLGETTGLSGVHDDAVVMAVFERALHLTFWGVFVVALLAAAVTWLIPVHVAAEREPDVASASLGDMAGE
ncbi:MFS transporter [Xanthobacter sp. DSM 24535]|uniref:MFS transporter n=1 Tax=Roseixanthobacter psychrophilus TaxID=3119917 RepID=UPI003727F237